MRICFILRFVGAASYQSSPVSDGTRGKLNSVSDSPKVADGQPCTASLFPAGESGSHFIIFPR